MKLLETVIAQIEDGDFEAAEEAWISHSSEAPDDLDYFCDLAQALSRAFQEDLAQTLLELYDDALIDKNLWRTRLELLRRKGKLMLGADGVHTEILSTLAALYPDTESFEALSEAVGLHRAPQDLKKNWSKADRLEGLLQRDVGTVVAMQGKGVGRVAEVSLELGSLKVDFGERAPMSVGFLAAPKLLEILDKEHVLYRKLEEKESLEKLRDEDPRELLHMVLRSYDKPMTAGQVRDVLSGVVDEKRWTSWWTAARKHPQVITHGKGGRQTYGWAESSDHALDTVWQAFEVADPRQRIVRLRRDGNRDEDLKKRMGEALAATGRSAIGSNSALAFEIRQALEDVGICDLEESWSKTALVAGDLEPLLAGIETKAAREELFVVMQDTRDDWIERFLEILPYEKESRTLDRGSQLLAEHDSKAYGRFLDTVLSRAAKSPFAFTWLAERAKKDEVLQARWPGRLARQILSALDQHAFGPFRSRLEALCETGGTLPRMLPHFDEEEARQTLGALERNRSLPDFVRKPLVTALELRFPTLRTEEVEQPLYALLDSIIERKGELKRLLEDEIPKNRAAIEEARAMGDLRENFEYKSARSRHEYLNQRVAKLNAALERARPLALADIEPDEVRIGTTVILENDQGKQTTFSILGPWESDPDRGVLSYESEIGEGLLGLEAGDEITLEDKLYRIESISRYGD